MQNLSASAEKSGEKPVVGLERELENPFTRALRFQREVPRQPHRHGHPRDGKLSHERAQTSPGRFACDEYSTASRRTTFSCSNSLIRFRASRSSAPPLVFGRAWLRRRPQHAATTSATSSAGRRSPLRSA